MTDGVRMDVPPQSSGPRQRCRGHRVYLAAPRLCESSCPDESSFPAAETDELPAEQRLECLSNFTAASGGENTSGNKQQTLSVRLGPAETLQTADGCAQPLVTGSEVTETLRRLWKLHLQSRRSGIRVGIDWKYTAAENSVIIRVKFSEVSPDCCFLPGGCHTL